MILRLRRRVRTQLAAYVSPVLLIAVGCAGPRDRIELGTNATSRVLIVEDLRGLLSPVTIDPRGTVVFGAGVRSTDSVMVSRPSSMRAFPLRRGGVATWDPHTERLITVSTEPRIVDSTVVVYDERKLGELRGMWQVNAEQSLLWTQRVVPGSEGVGSIEHRIRLIRSATGAVSYDSVLASFSAIVLHHTSGLFVARGSNPPELFMEQSDSGVRWLHGGTLASGEIEVTQAGRVRDARRAGIEALSAVGDSSWADSTLGAVVQASSALPENVRDTLLAQLARMRVHIAELPIARVHRATFDELSSSWLVFARSASDEVLPGVRQCRIGRRVQAVRAAGGLIAVVTSGNRGAEREFASMPASEICDSPHQREQ